MLYAWILGFLSPLLAYASYDFYPSYSNFYHSQQADPVISMDMDPQHLLDTSFRIAAREERLDDMKKLLSEGANMNAVSDEGRTALMYSARNCSIQISQELLEHNAEVNITDKEGESALIYATIESCVPVVKLLLRSPTIDLLIKDHEGRTAIDYAADQSTIEVGGPATQILRLLQSRNQYHRHSSRTQVKEGKP